MKPQALPMLTAVVLVAGTGTRLRPLTNDRPKCLVDVGGRAILARLLDRLARAGVTRACLATGHRAAALDEHFARHPSPLAVELVANPRFATTNNAYSLKTTEGVVGSGGFLLCDGDVLLAPGVVERLVAASGSALLVEPRTDLGDEEMKAIVVDGRVTKLAKTLPPAEAFGESIGVQKIGDADAPLLWETLSRMMAGGGENEYYEAAFQEMIDRGATFSAIPVTGDEWTEIDDVADLERANARTASWDR